MDNNLYIDYLNSLHNYNAQNENAYGERNIDNQYFKDVMVRVGLCDYIKENLTVKKTSYTHFDRSCRRWKN